MKHVLIGLAIGCAVVLFPGCGTPGPDVQVYYSRPDLGGVYRAQASELVAYEATAGWYAMRPEQFESLVNYCLNPDDKAKTRKRIHQELRKDAAPNLQPSPRPSVLWLK